MEDIERKDAQITQNTQSTQDAQDIQVKAPNAKRRVNPATDRLRIILMFLMCIDLFGFPTPFGGIIQTLCGFVPIAFFILSGYLVLRNSPNRSKRIGRAIRRSAVAFVVFTVVLLAINFFYYRALGANIFEAFKSRRFIFNFVALNVWGFEIGSIVWYVQALLYAYIIIYFLDKFKLLKYDWLIAVILLVFAVLTGELAGVFKWNIAGYGYLPGNFLTRALPYILLGSFFYRNIDAFSRIKEFWYVIFAVAGAILSIAEPILLAYFNVPGYYGHLIGYGIIAASVCLLAFLDFPPIQGFESSLKMSRHQVNIIYYICQPVSVLIALGLARLDEEIFIGSVGFMGIITFLVCFGIAWLVALLGRTVFKKKNG